MADRAVRTNHLQERASVPALSPFFVMNKIEDYALIGDCHSVSLVGRDGSIDWTCFPRFDSTSVFAKVLDEEKGGSFEISPAGEFQNERSYLDDTNVLVSVFRTRGASGTLGDSGGGTLEVTDCMPVGAFDDTRPAAVKNYSSILRRLKCTEGELDVQCLVAPRFEYGSFTPRFRLVTDRLAEVVGGADALWVTASESLDVYHDSVRALWSMKAGDEILIEVSWSESFIERGPGDFPSVDDLRGRLNDTIAFWKEWIGRCRYEGEYDAPVRRSALALKAMTFAPTGALVAAPTTSLPEEIGGVRNWDYRYTWIRDTTLTLNSLLVLGFRPEADAFRHWLRRTTASRPQDIQIMYGIDGRRSLPEVELGHLSGHRGSEPVRIGNGAVKQLQLDVFGSMLEAAWLFVQAGGMITPTNWEYLRGLADTVCVRWREPDQGIWEIRDEPRHFVHSKLLCWVALDRALDIARRLDLHGPLEHWKADRDAIAAYLLEEVAADGWFPQYTGGTAADASCLLIPAMGLIPPDHPITLGTIQEVRRQLETDGLVHRYKQKDATDGLSGTEGAFLLCSFWLLDALIHSRQLEEAKSLLGKLISLANDVGLYAEEVDEESGEALGNFPQAFTHMALVTSCAHLTAAGKGLLPEPGTAYDFSAFALKVLKER